MKHHKNNFSWIIFFFLINLIVQVLSLYDCYTSPDKIDNGHPVGTNEPFFLGCKVSKQFYGRNCVLRHQDAITGKKFLLHSGGPEN